MKGTHAIQGETEVSGIKVNRGHCPFSKTSPCRAGKLVPYLRLHHPGEHCLSCLEDSPETPSHPTYGPTQDAFPYERLVLAHTSQLPKCSQTSNSWPQGAPGLALAAASLDSQLGFAWESPGPAQVAAISDCFIAQAGWPQAEHWWGLTLTCTTWETPEAAHPVDSYRLHQSTTTLLLHS